MSRISCQNIRENNDSLKVYSQIKKVTIVVMKEQQEMNRSHVEQMVNGQGYSPSRHFSLLNVALAAAVTCVCRQHGRLLLRPYL